MLNEDNCFAREARALVDRIHSLQHQQYDIKRALESAHRMELEDRVVLANALRDLLNSEPDALDESWVSHWCFNIGCEGQRQDDLHKRAFDHFTAKEGLQTCRGGKQ